MTHLCSRAPRHARRRARAIASRGFWTPYPDRPAEDLRRGPQQAGKQRSGDARQALRPRPAGVTGWLASDPRPTPRARRAVRVCDTEALLAAAAAAMPAWQNSRDAAPGVPGDPRPAEQGELRDRLAVMYTTGQGFGMAFQAAGRTRRTAGWSGGLCVPEMSFVPRQAHWEKPQGKNPAGDEEAVRGGRPRPGAGDRLLDLPDLEHLPGPVRRLATAMRDRQAAPVERAAAAISVRIAREVLRRTHRPNLVTAAVVESGDDAEAGHRSPHRLDRLHRRLELRPLAA